MVEDAAERYRVLCETITDGIVSIDMDGRLVECNQAFADMLGYSREELKHSAYRELTPEQWRETDDNILKEQIMKRGYSDEYEKEYIRKDGNLFPVSLRAWLIRDEAGRPKGMRAIIRNITERKKMENERGNERDLLQALMDNIPDAIYFKDVNSRFTRTNLAHAEMIGVNDPKAAIGKTDLDYYSEEFAREAYADEKKIVKTGTPLINKVEKIRRPNGYAQWVSATKVPIKDEEGKIVGIVGISRDITELKRLQEELLKSERLAAIGQLASAVGHEIRNPLGVIKNSVYFLGLRLKDTDGKVTKHLRIIEKEVNSANLIVGDLLDFARRKPPVLQETDLNEILRTAASDSFIPGNIKLAMKPGEMPRMFLDQEQLRRVFLNIILNAVQAMPDGGKLTIQTSKHDDSVRIEFTDTGVGIPEENLPKLFTPLFSTKAKGIGLGLTVCKQIIEAHDGNITVKSKVGEGSTFTIELPIRTDEARERSTLPAELPLEGRC